MGCNDTMDVACGPQRVSRFRYIGHEREHQSANLILENSKIYEGRVNKLIYDDQAGEGIVKGVEFTTSKGNTYALEAKNEVILSAGFIGTPKILQLSGIGDPLELEALGIPVVKELPDVGLHLKEHIGLSATARTNLKCPTDGHRDEEGKPKGGTHLGYLNDFLAQFYGFFKLPDTETWFELLLIEGCIEEEYTLTLTTILLTPRNEGRVWFFVFFCVLLGFSWVLCFCLGFGVGWVLC